jgi:hypothetical protein
MEVVVKHGEATAIDREDPDELAEPVLDPVFSVMLALSAEESPADAS